MRRMRFLVTAVVLLAVVPQLHAADPVEWRVVNVADGDEIASQPLLVGRADVLRA
jgi:hypothetical protein